MKQTQSHCRTISTAVRFLLLLLTFHQLTPAAFCQGRAIATVQTTIGRVSVKRNAAASYASLAARSNLHAGDIVATGGNSKASLLFYNGAQLRLNARSSVQITAPTNVGRGKTSLFRAISGQVWARLRPGQAGQTRSAIAGVRGTEFVLQLAADETTTLTVIEGEVQFFNPLGEVLVLQNQQSTARPGSAPTKPVTIQNAGLIIEWTVDLNHAIIPRETTFVSLDRSTLESETQRRRQQAQQVPQDAAVLRALGDALFDAAQYEAALQQYQKAQTLAPDNNEIATRVGNALLELGRVEEAEAAFLRIVEQQPNATAALLGLSAVALEREQAAQAQEFAQRAVTADANSAAAHIALGLSLLRQSGKQEEAATAFRAALNAEPVGLRYQAHAWLAMVYLSQNDAVAALREAREATRLAPNSGLAHGNLSLVHFFSGNTREAERAAQLAIRLNPDSVAARVARGQALLAQGDVDAATSVAAQAVALDPGLPQAHYLLGLADAGRRDWTHAARSLQEALRLSPDFLPAASALARVYNNMGRRTTAVALITEMLPRHRQADQVRAALGQVYYQQGQYEKATEEYELAVKANPASALYQAELARVSLDANRINQAITAGQKAVAMAPQVAQYHAILGLAYDYSNLSWRGGSELAGLRATAEREYRTALTLDPQNALARARLALLQNLSDPDTALNAYTQAFIFDPAISTQLQRGGVDTSVTVNAGSNDLLSGQVSHDDQALDGKLHSFTTVNGGVSGKTRDNDKTKALTYNQYVTFVPGPRTTLFAGAQGRRNRTGLPGQPNTVTDFDDYTRNRYHSELITARQRLGAGKYLWLGIGYRGLHARTEDPDPLTPPAFILPLSSFNPLFADLLPPGLALRSARIDQTARVPRPEIRGDFTVGRLSRRPTLLSLGYGEQRGDLIVKEDILLGAGPASFASFIGDAREKSKSSVLYAQASRQLTDRLSFVGQVRHQRVESSGLATLSIPAASVTRPSAAYLQSRLLPSVVMTYQANNKTTLRLFANKRIEDVAAFAFVPTESLLSTENSIFPRSDYFANADVLQFDVERYSPTRFMKLFAFHTRAERVAIGALAPMFLYRADLGQAISFPLNLPEIKRSGIGLRLEQRLSRTLYGSTLFVANRSTVTAPQLPFNNQTAPYQPRLLAAAALDYIDPKGNKLGVTVRHEGSYFQDDPLNFLLTPGAPRERFPARTYVDLRIAREPSVRHEVFFIVRNLFDRPSVYFGNFPGAGRQIQAGYTHRF